MGAVPRRRVRRHRRGHARRARHRDRATSCGLPGARQDRRAARRSSTAACCGATGSRCSAGPARAASSASSSATCSAAAADGADSAALGWSLRRGRGSAPLWRCGCGRDAGDGSRPVTAHDAPPVRGARLATSAGCRGLRSPATPGVSEQHDHLRRRRARRTNSTFPPSYDGTQPFADRARAARADRRLPFVPRMTGFADMAPKYDFIGVAPSGLLDGTTPYWNAAPRADNYDVRLHRRSARSPRGATCASTPHGCSRPACRTAPRCRRCWPAACPRPHRGDRAGLGRRVLGPVPRASRCR